jgi:putative transcriptional regulator
MMKTGILVVVLSLWMVIVSQDTAWVDDHPVARLKPGVLLFAVPELRDPNFFQTVVLLIHYEKAGAMGVIINKPTEFSLDEVLPDLEEAQKPPLPVFFGGPVSQNHMLVLLRSKKPPNGAIKVFKDVYYTGDKDVLIQMLRKQSSHKDLRVYAGFAGWAPGQLEHEVSRGDWVVSYANADMIFSEDPSKVWPEIFKIQEQIEIRNPQSDRPHDPNEHDGHPEA